MQQDAGNPIEQESSTDSSDLSCPSSVVINGELSHAITPSDYGATGDGVTDDTAALISWAASGTAVRKYIPAGVYKCSQELIFNPGDYVYGDGELSVIDFTGGIGGALRCVSVSGSLVPLPALASSVPLSTNTLSFVSAPSLVSGEVVLIWNPTDSSWSTWRPEYHAGEWARVATVSGNQATLWGLTYDTYIAASVQLYKLVGTQSTFRDFQIKQPATNNAGLVIDLIDSPVVFNVLASGGLYAGIDVRRCFDLNMDTRARQASAPSGNNYGLAVGNCQGGSIRGVYYGTRHSISLGGSPSVGSVSCRDIDIYANYKALDANINAIDLHGNTEDIRFHGVSGANGLVVAGKNHKWIGCKARGRTNAGIAVYMGEVVSGMFEFIGLSVETSVDPNPSGNGILSFQNFNANVTGECHFIFTGTSIKCPSTTVFPILFALNGTSASVNISFKGGLTFTAAVALTQVLRLRQFGTTGRFGSVCMPEVSGLPSTGCAYAVEVGSPIVSGYELPRQDGTVNVPVTTSTSLSTSAVSFRHAYPRVPSVRCSTVSPTVGGKRVVTGHQADATAGFVAIVATTDAAPFTASATAGVDWSVVLNI
ncbi:glycosyl hydrolase family 28-related protein [Pseudomonas sp. St290]|uniref:phage tailspike polysaccharide lyase family protein n=1 Tax=Pseudomonas sp. St290 TaxID=1602166 RepID=UPI001BB3426E|nr:glycosyl hydrolase family 28-related protein [Pseudomonas sp. St290]BBH31642.1 hypothetical protein PBDP_1179 [Pseudomonas sp. St290]